MTEAVCTVIGWVSKRKSAVKIVKTKRGTNTRKKIKVAKKSIIVNKYTVKIVKDRR